MLDRQWLNAFLPIGTILQDGLWKPLGAGTLCKAPPVLWLITAKHVVKSGSARMGALVYRTSAKPVIVDIDSIHKQHGLEWQFDDENDLAVGLMPIDPDFKIKAIDRSAFAGFDDILPSMQCLTVGCPYGIPGFDPTKLAPLVLDGIIAGIEESTKRLYLTAPTFPGNSGGPVLLIKPPYDPRGNLVVGRPTVLFGGVVLQYTVLRPKDPSVPSDLPPLHLGIATSADAVAKLLDSDNCKRQVGLALKKT